MAAYDEGLQAGKADEPEHGCPYTRDGFKRRDWLRGWESGRNSNHHVSPDHTPDLPGEGRTRPPATRWPSIYGLNHTREKSSLSDNDYSRWYQWSRVNRIRHSGWLRPLKLRRARGK